MRLALLASATLLVLAGCGEERHDRGAGERAAHGAAASAMDASFDKELGGGAAQPAARPAAQPAATAKPAATTAKPAAQAGDGPALEKGRPAWVDQPPVEEGRIYAVGGAPRGQRDAAQTNARKEIAKQLRVHIAGRDTNVATEIDRTGPGGQRVAQAMETFRSEATATVDRDLDGTRIVSLADDGRELWALAVLDCVAWAGRLRQEIAAVDAKLGAERDRIAAAGGGLRPAAQALRAVGPLAARREALISDLIQADPKGQLPPCPVDVPALIHACTKQLGAVTVRLEGAPDAVFAARTQDAMARLGLTVTEKAGSAIGIRLALRTAARELPNHWHKISVSGSATVIDPATGTIAGTLQIDESGTDPAENQANAKMLDHAAEALAKAIDERLLDLLAQ